jgi:hypothetical protein
MVSDLKVAKVNLNLMPPIACVAILQTIFYEAGYEFFNQVPSWPSLREVSGVPEEVIRTEVTRIVRCLTAELISWNNAVGATPYHVCQPSDLLLTATTTTPGTEVSFPVAGDGPTDMDVDTQLFLGQEVVMLLQNTGLRPRSPTSSVEGEPIRKRALLMRSSAGNSIPSYYSSSAPSEDVPMHDPVPSLAEQSGSSDTSMMVTDEGTNLSGFISSGLSMVSSTDYMAGSGTHMSMPGATVMMGSVAASVRSGFPMMTIMTTADSVKADPRGQQDESETRSEVHPAHVPLPGTPSSGPNLPALRVQLAKPRLMWRMQVSLLDNQAPEPEVSTSMLEHNEIR